MNSSPSLDISAAKAQLRVGIKSLRAALPMEERSRLSSLVCDSLVEWLDAEWLPRHPGEGVAVYLAMADEVNVDPVARFLQSRCVPTAAPAIGLHTLEMTFREIGDPARIQPAGWRIREPHGDAPEIPVTLVLVPGVAFTSAGERLGMGHGCYDRTLTSRHTAVGVGFSFQIVPVVPCERHDRVMQFLATPEGVLSVGG